MPFRVPIWYVVIICVPFRCRVIKVQMYFLSFFDEFSIINVYVFRWTQSLYGVFPQCGRYLGLAGIQLMWFDTTTIMVWCKWHEYNQYRQLAVYCNNGKVPSVTRWLIVLKLLTLIIHWSEWSPRVQSYTMPCHYNAVNCPDNSHKRHPIARRLGRGMECLLWVHTLIYILPR